MANEQVLGAKIQVRDNFSTALNKLVSQISKAETNLNKLSSILDKNTDKICNGIDKVNQKFTMLNANMSIVTSHIQNSMGDTANEIEKNQIKSITNIEKRYDEMAKNIKKTLKNVNEDVKNQNNSNNNNSKKGANSSSKESSLIDFNKAENTIQSVLEGNFMSIIGKLSIIGTVATGVLTATKLVDSSINSGFDLLNKATGNMLNADGIEEAINTAMEFESGKQSLKVFFGEDKYNDVYKMATGVANSTFASEKDTISIATKLGQVGVNMTGDQMKSILGVAATRPSVGIDHIGLAIQEAIDGRISMLKNYGINNFKLQDYYKYLQKNDPKQAKDLKGALNKKGTAGDAQKYFDLVVSFIDSPFSHMAGYADQYTQTLKGKMDRIEGLFDKAKADIMGYDTDNGEVIENGLFDHLGKAIDELKSKLEDGDTVNFFKEISSALGNVAGGLSKAFMKLIDGVDLDKVANMINEVADVVCESLNKLIDSGVLDELIDKLPTIVNQVLKFKGTEMETDAKVKIDTAEGKFGQAFVDKAKGTEKKYYEYFGGNYEEDIESNPLFSVSALFDKINSGLNSIGIEVNTGKEYIGATDLQTAINNSDIDETNKTDLKDFIEQGKHEGKHTYYINIDHINSDNVDNLIEEIKQASENRK